MKNGIDLHLHRNYPLLLLTDQAGENAGDRTLRSRKKVKLVKYMTAPADCQDLNEYLEKFDSALFCNADRGWTDTRCPGCMQSNERAGAEICGDPFAPQLHTKKGLTQEQVVKAVLKGLLW